MVGSHRFMVYLLGLEKLVDRVREVAQPDCRGLLFSAGYSQTILAQSVKRAN